MKDLKLTVAVEPSRKPRRPRFPGPEAAVLPKIQRHMRKQDWPAPLRGFLKRWSLIYDEVDRIFDNKLF